MTIKILKANNGDAIIISFFDKTNTKRNIVVDGGTKKTYKYKNHKGKLEAGDLKKEIDKIEERNEKIDLLILTPVDEDHIGGLLKWIESNSNFDKLVKKVWFNSGKLIFEYFKKDEIRENLIKVNVQTNTNTSIKQGITFEEYISSRNIWQKELIRQNMEINIFDLVFQILTPSVNNLESLLHKWNKEKKENLTSKVTDYNIPLQQLIDEDEYTEDHSVYNGSSISFILNYKEYKLLFLADAHPLNIVEGLKGFGYNEANKIEVSFVKVSHHGSKNNTSYELLKCIDSDLFLISSNGSVHNLPDKQCLARIINNKPKARFGFNYPQMVTSIFSRAEIEKFNIHTINLEKEIVL